MSRVILIEQILAMSNSGTRDWLMTVNQGSEGGDISFEIEFDDDYVPRIIVIGKKDDQDVAYTRIKPKLDRVPIIKKYLQITGGTQLAYYEFAARMDSYKQKAWSELFDQT